MPTALRLVNFFQASCLAMMSMLALPGVETPPLQPPADVTFFHSGEDGHATWSSDPTQPIAATGGVKARYEGIFFHCDQLFLQYSPLAGTKENAPNEGSLKPGAAGPADNRVVLDTRKATAPTIGFRGLFTPAAVIMHRLADASLPPPKVSYQVDLPDAGDFQGQLKTPDGWASFRGWAENIQLVIGAEVISGSLTNMHIMKITLNGRPATEGRPQRNAEVNRLKKDVVLPEPEHPLTAEMVSGHNDAKTIFITFDELGRPGATWAGKNNVWGTDLNLFSVVPGERKPTP